VAVLGFLAFEPLALPIEPRLLPFLLFVLLSFQPNKDHDGAADSYEPADDNEKLRKLFVHVVSPQSILATSNDRSGAMTATNGPSKNEDPFVSHPHFHNRPVRSVAGKVQDVVGAEIPAWQSPKASAVPIAAFELFAGRRRIIRV